MHVDCHSLSYIYIRIVDDDAYIILKVFTII